MPDVQDEVFFGVVRAFAFVALAIAAAVVVRRFVDDEVARAFDRGFETGKLAKPGDAEPEDCEA